MSEHLQPKPLTHTGFYILLVLSRNQLHGYAISGRIWSESLGAINATGGQLYPTLRLLIAAKFIETSGLAPTGKQQKERLHYRITPKGLVRLKEELHRLKHAVDIGEAAGFF